MSEFPRAEENYKTIEKLLAVPENKKCADCTASSADGYICLDFGTFVCFHCAEILRSHNHKVKKISPNNIRDEDLQIVQENGNRKSSDKWLVRYTGDHPEPNNVHDRKYRIEYLKLKYDDKKWARHDAAPFTVEYADGALTPRGQDGRDRSVSSPPAFTAPINPFTSQPTNYYAAAPAPHVHVVHQQQMMQQQQLLANQQHLQQQHIQQQMLQQQLQQQQAMLNQQYMQQQHQQMFLQQQQQQQQIPKSASNPVLGNPNLTQSLSQNTEVRTRSPSMSNVPAAYAGPRASPTPVSVAPVLSPRGVSPLPVHGSTSPAPGAVSPRAVSPFDAGQQTMQQAGRQRSNSKIGVCPQCGLGVDSREMGKHKLKECAYRTASAQ